MNDCVEASCVHCGHLAIAHENDGCLFKGLTEGLGVCQCSRSRKALGEAPPIEVRDIPPVIAEKITRWLVTAAASRGMWNIVKKFAGTAQSIDAQINSGDMKPYSVTEGDDAWTVAAGMGVDLIELARAGKRGELEAWNMEAILKVPGEYRRDASGGVNEHRKLKL